MTDLMRATAVWANRFAIACVIIAILMLVTTPLLVDAASLASYVVALYVINGVAIFIAGYLLHRFSVKLKQGALVQAVKLEHSYWQISTAVALLTFVMTVAAVAVPAVRGTLGKSAQARTARDMEAIRADLEKYALANHQYPTQLNLPKAPFRYKPTCENGRCYAYTLEVGP